MSAFHHQLLKFHHLNCERSRILYLLECSKYKINTLGIRKPYLTLFKVRLHNHEKYVTTRNNIRATNYLNFEGHEFKRHAKIIVTDPLNQKNLDK